MSFGDDFVDQLPDIDPTETQEWLDSLDAVAGARGRSRAVFLMNKLTERGHELQFGNSAPMRTPYVNTIPPDQERDRYWFPGDELVEKRIRAYIRWNAAVMVAKANKHAADIGGHLSSFASSAALYEVGFNRAKPVWNASPTSTASTDWSGSGMASAMPFSARTSGRSAASFARIAATGSTAITSPTRECSKAHSFPVPAARSSTVEVSPRSSASTIASIAGAG